MTNSFQDYKSSTYVPMEYESEAVIERDAPFAIRRLKREEKYDDLINILGLSNYYEPENDMKEIA